MKVYLMTDYEGVAGVWNWEPRDDVSPAAWDERQRGRRLLTGEVNAAVEGFLAGGATEVIVNDGHGAGYTIDIERVHPRARVIHGHDRPFWLPLLDETCAATALVGAHPRYGTPRGNLRHSMSHNLRYTVNGVEMGEIGMQALIAGHFGVPFVFLSGDAHACREVEELIPGVTTAPVKEGLSTLSAVTLAPEAARELIRNRASESLCHLADVRPYSLGSPVTMIEEHMADTSTGDGPVVLHRRVVEAPDPVELFMRFYSYPR